jgi:hypothetical protein
VVKSRAGGARTPGPRGSTDARARGRSGAVLGARDSGSERRRAGGGGGAGQRIGEDESGRGRGRATPDRRGHESTKLQGFYCESVLWGRIAPPKYRGATPPSLLRSFGGELRPLCIKSPTRPPNVIGSCPESGPPRPQPRALETGSGWAASGIGWFSASKGRVVREGAWKSGVRGQRG